MNEDEPSRRVGAIPKTTIREVAQRAGVSTGTVSRVLNGHDNVAPQLREQVRAALAELDYLPKRPKPPRTSRLVEIGFLLVLAHWAGQGDLMSSFWARILHGAEREARDAGAKVRYRSLHVGDRSSAEIRAELAALQLDAALIVGVAPPSLLDAVRGISLPFVLVDGVSPDRQADAVVSDWLGGAEEAVGYLLDAGHRAIGFIGGPLAAGSGTRGAIYSIEQRAIGYRNALFHAGIAPDPAWVESTELTPESGYAACLRLLDRSPEVTALFCANDPTASGVLRALGDRGLRTPEQVSVVGFDDDLAENTRPRLTTVRVDQEGMGVVAVRTLVSRSSRPDGPWVTSVLPVDLIARDSVGPRPLPKMVNHNKGGRLHE